MQRRGVLLVGALLLIAQAGFSIGRSAVSWGVTAEEVIGVECDDLLEQTVDSRGEVQTLRYRRSLLGHPAELRYTFTGNRVKRITYTALWTIIGPLVQAVSLKYGPAREQVRGGGSDRLYFWHTDTTLISLTEGAGKAILSYSPLCPLGEVIEEPLPADFPEGMYWLSEGGRAQGRGAATEPHE